MNADEYYKLADVEDQMWYFRALHAHLERELLMTIGSRPSDILDAGCGTGGLIRRLAPQHPTWRWTGVDASEIACNLARARTHGYARAPVEIVRGEVEHLPFADGRFDAVVSADVLYHLDNDAAALREFARVLRPGGALIVNVPAYRWLWSYHDTAVHSRRRYGRAELRDKLADARFEVRTATHWNALALPLVVARRKLLPAPKEGSDVRLYPPSVESAFNFAMRVERTWLDGVGRLPFGTSILASGRKP